MAAGATLKELAYIMALTFRESAGGDVQKLIAENIQCCPR